MMAEISPGLASRPLRRSKKLPTQTTKQHRYEPFSKRVARLKIDPIHRIARKVNGARAEQRQTSHFRESLETWNDLNLSQNYTDFARQANPLCETLPQLLYHADKLAALLLEYIGKRDVLSLESLLSLLAHFAHDLGGRFEKYFPDSVSLVANVAATHPAPEAIEWSFTCLAWIFKFLSKLLVPDLRPLLGIMVPYLGKTHQKEYITRFTAESMAFLLRKAAIAHSKDGLPLRNALTYLLNSLQETTDDRDLESYKGGIMFLLSETIKGVDYNIHECGSAVLSCLLECVRSEQDPTHPAVDVLLGVWTNIIHHTTVETAFPLIDLLQTEMSLIEARNEISGGYVPILLAFVTVGTRKGSRIRDWSTFNRSLISLAKVAVAHEIDDENTKRSLTTSLALTVCYSPLEGLLPSVSPLSELVLSDKFAANAILFYSLLNKLCADRLGEFFSSNLQQFVHRQWKQQEMSLLTFLLERQKTLAESFPSNSSTITIPADWKTRMLKQLKQRNDEPESAALLSSYLSVLEASQDDSKIQADLVSILHSSVKEALQQPSLSDQYTRLFLGKGFEVYIKLSKKSGKLDLSLWKKLCSQAHNFKAFPAFWKALLQYVDFAEINNTSGDSNTSLSDTLVDNMLSTDLSIKQVTLDLMERLHQFFRDVSPEVRQLASEILSIPYGHQSVRELSRLVRNMALLWQSSSKDTEPSKFIPYFLLGLLSPKNPQLHGEITQALAEICGSPTGEAIVSEVLGKWLQTETEPTEDVEGDENKPETRFTLTPFQCVNLHSVQEVTETCSETIDQAGEKLQRDFQQYHILLSATNPAARSLALTVLQAVPELAEKRSRQIVPLFMSSVHFDNPSDWSPASDESVTSATLSAHEKVQDWSRNDRKAMLKLFGKFHNPKVLFRSADVYNALLEVISKGDSEMQKLALKAIFTFKNTSIRPYEEHLQNLTDDKRFRDELAVFFHGDPKSSSIEDAHREGLFPVVLRLLYGQMINRSGSRSNHGGQEARRKVILRTLFRLQEEEVRAFLLIGCGPLADLKLTAEGPVKEHALSRDIISSTQQHGFLNMVETILETLKGQIAPYGQVLQTSVIYCLIRATRKLDGTQSDLDRDESLSRRIRRVAIHCLDMLFTNCPDLEWTPYMPTMFQEVINPRLENFAIETAQGTSGLLHLFGTWASNRKTITLLNNYNKQLIPIIASCLTVPSAKDEVKTFVLNNVLVQLCETIQSSGTEDEEASSVLLPHVNALLVILDDVLRQNPSRTVQDAVISTLSILSIFATSPESSVILLGPLTLILRQPTEKVSPQTKGNLLKALLNLLSVSGPQLSEEMHNQIFETVSSLFSFFKDRPSRNLLVNILEELATRNKILQVSSEICADLNSYSSTKLDEVDYDRRLKAFNNLMDVGAAAYSAIQWSPILHTILFFCREEDDFAIRSNAVATLKMFIQQSATDTNKQALSELRRKVVYPTLRKSLKAASESIRADHLTMIGIIVQHDPEWDETRDMQGLLANNDEEASFFNNALHIQQHRRLRALRRLEAEVKLGIISSVNITTIFLPLLEQFVFDPDEDPSAQNLAGQAIVTIGLCLEATEWGQYKVTFRRYKSYMKSKPEVEKSIIKLLSATTDALYRSAVPSAPQDANGLAEKSEASVDRQTRLAKTLPKHQKLSQELISNFIPDLTAFVHQKDEALLSLRIPIAIATVRLLKILTEEEMALLLPSILLDVANILKSRVQESRDAARRTLAETASILGSSCLGYILRELRSTLARGYQLHVLSYTVHSLLVSMTEFLQPGEIDYCLPTLVAVVMDDIFGVVGQEKDAEDYISKMKEVKSSKSFDSMELLAKTSTIRHLVELIKPIQALLSENINAKQAKQVDELLRRIGVGLTRNPHAGDRDILMFSFEVIQEFYKQQQRDSSTKEQAKNESAERFIIDNESRRARKPRQSSAVFAYRLVRFALDLLRSVFSKHPDLATIENVHGFLPVIGDVLVDGQEDVRTSAMRLLSSIIKLPMPELDQNGPLYALQAVKVVRDSTNTNAESSQAALKLITAILRERKQVEMRDSDLSYLLNRITPDLDEPDRQGVTFNFVKAVMARKIALPEIYDLVDQVGVMMVTNHTRGTRDAARGVFVHFILNYPQAKSRWTKQLKFLVKNLDYAHPEGRQSVMEAVHILLAKSGEGIAQELAGSFFIPVLLIMSNDDSSQCREMAGALLAQLFAKADDEQLKSFLASLRSWTEQTANAALAKAGLQAYKIYFDVDLPGANKEVIAVRSRIENMLSKEDDEEEDSWEPVYYALQLLLKLCTAQPAAIMSKAQVELWQQIRQLLSHRHSWVQHSASSLIGSLFHDIARTNAETGLQELPLNNSHGLKLQADHMREILKSSLRILKNSNTGDDLRLQTVRNLVFLGRCFIVNGLTIDTNKNTTTTEANTEDDADGNQTSDSEDEDIADTPAKLSALDYLYHQLSRILRREPPALKTQYLHPKVSTMQLLAALINLLPTNSETSPLSSQTLTSIILPLNHLTDTSLAAPRNPDPSFQTLYTSLTSSATEVLDLLQQKLGSRLYVQEMSKVQKLVRERREERSRKRKVGRVADPEAYALDKRRRREGEKRRKKERGNEFKGRRRGF